MKKTLRQGVKRLFIGLIALFVYVILEMAVLLVGLSILVLTYMLDILWLPVAALHFVSMKEMCMPNAIAAIRSFPGIYGYTVIDYLLSLEEKLSNFLKGHSPQSK